jgi:hypothetical protein
MGSTRSDIEPTLDDTARMLIVCSAGGHLAQMLALESWTNDFERTWVSFALPDAQSLLAGETVVWAHHPTTRNVPNLVRNLGVAWKTLRRIRPHVVTSCGAGVAVPFFWVARLLGIPTIYIEVFDRIDTVSLSARLCRPVSTLVLVQWAEQQTEIPEALLIGPLL